jgi:hypothetical protein
MIIMFVGGFYMIKMYVWCVVIDMYAFVKVVKNWWYFVVKNDDLMMFKFCE